MECHEHTALCRHTAAAGPQLIKEMHEMMPADVTTSCLRMSLSFMAANWLPFMTFLDVPLMLLVSGRSKPIAVLSGVCVCFGIHLFT